MQLIHVRVYGLSTHRPYLRYTRHIELSIGETEYWFALIKVLLVIVFILVGLIYDWGGVHGHPGPVRLPHPLYSLNFFLTSPSTHQGLSNFRDGQAFIGGFSSFAQTFVWAFYSYGGVELVTLAAGESSKPHKTIPRAIKATFFRVVLFYVLTILTIGLNINHADKTLLYAANSKYPSLPIPPPSYLLMPNVETRIMKAEWRLLILYDFIDSDVTASPLTVVFMRAGFGAASHVVNAVLLTAVLSATNSCFYASSRILLSLSRAGQAPKVFGWVNRRGVPVPALL